MSDKAKSSLEKIILAGIGVMATTAEKSAEILEDLVRKGELTVEQGKALNEELKHTVKNTVSEASNTAQEFVVSRFIQNLDRLTPDERAQVLSKLQDLEKNEEAAES